MSIEMIGKQIASLRKEKGIKQEELAKYVCVSTQAVSKWENGGVPDIELLPKIADFFSISIDSLFGRNITDYSDLNKALCKKIIDTPPEQRFKLTLNYCWDMQRATFGSISNDGSIEDFEKKLGKHEQTYSSIMSNHGFTRMGIANKLQYYLLVPEIQNTDIAFFEGVDYITFFKAFSDKDVFDACIFLNKRESNKAFTENLFIKNLKIESDKAKQIIDVLKKYDLVYETQIEMDDETQIVYNFRPTPSFIAFLIFAKEMINPPNRFHYYSGGRNKPYLK